MSYKTIQLESSPGLLKITLNRAEVRNAFNEQIIQELTDIFQKEVLEESVRVVLISGHGECFSAGADLNWMKKTAGYSYEQNLKDAEAFSAMLSSLNACPKTVIVAAHGAALGGGCGLISIADYALAVQDTLFGFTEGRLGLIPAVISPFVVNKIGMSHARSLFLTAIRFDAKKAYDIGLVHEVCASQEALQKRSGELVNELLKLSPHAQLKAKELLFTLSGLPAKKHLKKSAEFLAEIRAHPEAIEGVSSFLEKRYPKWLKNNG